MAPLPFDNKFYWQIEINKINSGVPKGRKTLQQLLNMENPYLITREDQKIEIPENEIKKLVEYFSSNADILTKIRVPFIFLQQGDSYRTSGSKFDIWAVERLFGHVDSSIIISIKEFKPKHRYYYTYQINRLKREFPNLVFVLYSI